MRPKVVAAVLFLAVAVLAIAALVSNALRPQSPALPAPGRDSSAETFPGAESAGSSLAPAAAPDWSPPVLAPAASALGNQVATNAVAEDAAHERYVKQRIAELEALAMNNDAASRDAILAELQNPDKEIRHAALEAAIQFGDRSVVPRLQEIADQTEDSAEKAEILEAIDYLNLPSLTEYLAERRAQAAANGQTNQSQTPADRIERPSRRRQSQTSTSPGNP